MTAKKPVLSLVTCGAAPAAGIGSLIKEAIARGWTVQVIATPSALPFFDAKEIEELTGSPVRSQYSKPGAPRSRIPDAIIVAPATFNTINQWALGIAGTYALGVLAEQTGMGIPAVVLPFVSDALASRPPFQRSVKALRAEGVSVLLAPGGAPAQRAHSEGDHVAGFPWRLALDEVSAMTGFGESSSLSQITCVELGAALAAEATRNLAGFPAVRVVNADAETWERGSHAGTFGMLFAATAWHWLDPGQRRPRQPPACCGRAGTSRCGGAWHVIPDGGGPFFSQIQDVYDEIGDGEPDGWVPPTPRTLPDSRAEIEASGLFGDVMIRRFDWELWYTADDYIRPLDTFSGHISME